jgi:dTDP-glucose 4,6-dehydratase
VKVLVCGGSGFVGSDFVRRVLDRHDDWEVVVVDKLVRAGDRKNLRDVEDDPRFSFVRGDIRDAAMVAAVAAGADAIVNFAVERPAGRPTQPDAFLMTDVLGTHVLLEWAREHPVWRMVQVSTEEVYGSVPRGSFNERDAVKAAEPYTASKAAGDLMALSYYAAWGLPVVVTRGSRTYGPRQPLVAAIPRLIADALGSKRMSLYGDGRDTSDWLHVDDHADGIEAALLRGRPGEVYNLGGGTQSTTRKAAAVIADELLLDGADIVQMPDRRARDRRAALACDKARGELGWRPSVDFEQGLRETVGWYADNRSWWREKAPSAPALAVQ